MFTSAFDKQEDDVQVDDGKKLGIVIAPDTKLIKKSKEVEEISEDHKKLVADMFTTLDYYGGIGLAAPQVGKLERIIIIDVPKQDEAIDDSDVRSWGRFIMINPTIKELSSAKVSSAEGCLSVPGVRIDVARPIYVVVEYTSLAGERMTLKARGLLSCCIQHEIDHLNGVIIVEHLSKLKKEIVLKRLRKLKKQANLQ